MRLFAKHRNSHINFAIDRGLLPIGLFFEIFKLVSFQENLLLGYFDKGPIKIFEEKSMFLDQTAFHDFVKVNEVDLLGQAKLIFDVLGFAHNDHVLFLGS